MVETKARRGRPIGTGIDDSDRIARLAELLKTQPDLKTTTAIRVMGFSDPSTIRRLRDKFKAFQISASNPAAHTPPSSAHLAPRKPEAAVLAGKLQLVS
jgi:hypothetical protein